MKNKISSVMLLIALLAALVPAAIPAYEAQAQSELIEVEIQPDGANMNDAHIVSTAATTNYGSSTELGVGESNAGSSVYRSLLEFDLTGLPYDMDVLTATLTLTVDQDFSDGGTMCAYGVHVDWVEGQATWNLRKQIGVSWQTAGASGANDRELEDEIGCVELSGGLEAGQTVALVLSPPDVEAMRKQNYFGFLLKMEDESDDLYIFRSSDHGTEADRPKLSLSYNPDTPLTDPGWICVDGTYGIHTIVNCPTYALMSPFSSTGSSPLIGGAGLGLTAALLQCDPYPRCVNDYPIYYRLQWAMTWDDPWHSVPESILTQWFTIPGASNITLGVVSCPKTGTVNGRSIGDCEGYYEGVILPSQLPVNYSAHHTVGYLATQSLALATTSLSWDLYLSLTPFDQDCADDWYVPLPETFVIDPLIETPLGIYGEPADNQIYETVIGQTYMVRVLDGPWDDGVDDERTDAAVSLDGENWMTWQEFSMLAFCIDVIPQFMENPDYRILYFEATTEEFHIRVNDIEDEFDDNDNHNETPFSYAIGIAFSLAGPVECESQFTWDDVNDWIASVNVIATEEDVPALTEFNEPMIAGEWYAIEVASGTWNESGGGAPRVDMEFLFTYVMGWEDLAEGSNLVYCVSADGLTVFIQAPNNETLDLHLRVNDQDEPQNWADNAGALGVNIYRVTFTRTITGCELQFDVGDFVAYNTVDGTAANGKQFANVFSSGDISFSYGLTPGGWYMLETMDGPWWRTFTGGGYESNTHYYDMQLKTGADNTWYSFEEWPFAECVVTVDALGHQRVFFQAPDEGGMQYFIRIAGAGPFTRGWMGWNLYQAIDLDLTGLGECSDFTYNPESTLAIGQIDSWLSGGNLINGLANDEYFAIHIESANTASDPPFYQHSGWWESSSSEEERDDLQLTVDGGGNWQTLPNHPAVLCYYHTPEENELVFFVRVMNGQSWKMRAASETFSNNIGSVFYRVHSAAVGDIDPWAGCMDDYTAHVPALNEHEWIPVKKDDGIQLWSNIWMEGGIPPGPITPGHVYMVGTAQGPWYDNVSETGSYLAQLSSDGGENWYLFDEHPDVICYDREQTRRWWKAIFAAETGQEWKIRVADTETDVFTDNSGALGYKLWLVNEFPDDPPGPGDDPGPPGDISFDACEQALLRPGSLSLDQIGELGNYLGDWIQYINRSIISYLAWCPRHTEMIISAVQELRTKEPLATVDELGTISKNVALDVAAYDWGGGDGPDTAVPDYAWSTGYEDTSIFAVESPADFELIVDRVLPFRNPQGRVGRVATSPWDGDDLINLTNDDGLPPYYYTCNTAFTDSLPTSLRSGVCFVSAYWKHTGAAFWLQLSLDIGAIFLLFRMVKGAAQSLIYMMTGVRPWTKDGAQRMIIDVANGSELIQPVDQWRSPNRRR